MAPLPPPQGMSETDYETIEAAVTETVRGRWFLGEFARRNRTAEMRQLLEAIGRIEGAVASGPSALPPADPSIRLMMQRIKEIAAQLETLSSEMRDAGIDPRFPEDIDHQARAVAGLMRGAPRPALPPRPDRIASSAAVPAATASVRPEPAAAAAPAGPTATVRMPRADLPPSLAGPALAGPALAGPALAGPALAGPALAGSAFAGSALAGPALAEPALAPASHDVAPDDPRLAALSALDGLTLAKKLALFS